MEINFLGYMRTLLMPEELQEIPQRITGICRLAKVLPNSSTPYTSIINLEDLPATDVVNYILKESYQVDSQIFLSDESDQAIMITKLPRKNYKKEEAVKRPSLGEYWLKNKKNFNSIFSKALNEDTEIVEEMKSLNLEYIGGTDIKFKCSCSLDRMINGVRSLSAGDIDAVFEEDKEIETKCDYCKSVYKITKEML